ncbi:MAG: hypothetical protein PHV13_02265 [Candidatus ainarchaeum sp.]|nr:hypothetical protein [Candidatus ainarchaeum sp.]
MALDIKKCFDASLMPAAVVIAIGILATLVGRFVPTLACVLGLPVMLAGLIVLAWAGYRAVKEMRMDIIGAAVTGLLAGLIAALVGGIISLLLMIVLGAAGTGAAGVALFDVVAILGLVIGTVVGAVEGAVCGAVGGFVANMKK